MIDREQIEIEVYPTNPRGGQHCGMERTTVKIKHKLLPISAECGLSRSQFRNREIAEQMLEWALLNE